MTLISVSGLYLDIPAESIPPPPASQSGVVQAANSSGHGPRSTLSMSFEPCGVKHAVEVASACRVRVEMTGVFGHNMPGAIVYASVVRTKSTGEVLALKGGANLAAAKIPSPLDFAGFHIDVMDDVATAGSYEYELYIRQSSSATGSAGYLGRRGQDIDPNIETVIALTVLDP